MIITISGMPGSGKTSVAKLLSERLGLPFYSIGGLRAKMAEKRGLTIDELNVLGERDQTTDTSVDDYQRELGKKSDNFIIEGRLSWYFIPQSFKIFLDCNLEEAAKRIFMARQLTGERPDEPLYASAAETLSGLEARIASDKRRYASLYGVDYQDPAHYDLVIDTSNNPGPQVAAKEILSVMKARTLV